MKFILASNNGHKIEEVKRILQPMGHRVLSLVQAGIVANPEENGSSFEENAMIKAMAIKQLCNAAVIADDSGLVVDALDGAPGVYSARFAGQPSSDKANNQKLLALMQGLPKNQRSAKFVSAIAVVLPNGCRAVLRGECKGFVGTEEKGQNGFGYDPLFYVGEKSYAQLSPAQKDAISHRSAALAKLQQFLQKTLPAQA